jgi:integrase
MQAIIMHNPASLVDPPRKPIREMLAPTGSQASQLIVAAKNHRLEALFHLAITTGVRESELLGFK